MRIYSGDTNKGRLIEGDVHYYHCGGRQEKLKNMTNAQGKRLRHRDRREGKTQAAEGASEHPKGLLENVLCLFRSR